MRLQTTGGVDGVPPQVVRELPPTDDTRHDRARGDPDPNPDRLPARPTCFSQALEGGQRHLCRRLDMVVARLRGSRDRHVRVADRLDLLQTEPIRDRVEGREHGIQCGDELCRSGAAGLLGEADQVGEDDGDIRVALGDVSVFRCRIELLQSLGDLFGQDVAQQTLRSLPLPVELMFTQEQQARRALQDVGAHHAHECENDEEVVAEDDVDRGIIGERDGRDVVEHDEEGSHRGRIAELQSAHDVGEHQDQHHPGVAPVGSRVLDKGPVGYPDQATEQDGAGHEGLPEPPIVLQEASARS